MTAPPGNITDLVARMRDLLAPLEERADANRFFLATYMRTTIAVGDEIGRGGFQAPEWVEQWDVTFANLYLDALDQWNAAGDAPGPWAVAFRAARDEHLPPLRHVLLGMNAHINYDLPQALLAAITDEEFDDESLIAARAQDHERMDQVLASRVKAEDEELVKVEQPGDRTWLDRLMTPFNQAGTRRFLKEAAARCGPTPASCRPPAAVGRTRWPPVCGSWRSCPVSGWPTSRCPARSSSS